MPIPMSAVIQNLIVLVKYVVVLVAVILASKFFFNRDMCKVDSEDPGMRPAIGSTRTWLNCDRDGWAEPALGDIMVAYREAGGSSQDARAFPFRVVAVAGDWMKLEGGDVVHYRNFSDRDGQGESYPGAVIKRFNSLTPVPKIQVPRGYVFLLSDNRQDQIVGSPRLIPVSGILGKVRL